MEPISLKGRMPFEIIESFDKRGIVKLTPPQELAIKAGLLEGTNLVVAAPTASGKTLIAEIGCVNSILSKRMKAIYIAPMRALVSEKYAEFKAAYPYIKSAMSIGDLDSADQWLSDYEMVFVSTEKFDSLIRHGVDWLAQIGCLIFDEVHMLGDMSRGPTLEILITKLMLSCRAQMIALSATIGNAKEIAKWLGAKLIESDYRPVKLTKGIIYNSSVYSGDDEPDTSYILNGSSKIPEIRLAEDTLSQKKQALIFYSTRRNAESGALKMATALGGAITKGNQTELDKVSKSIMDVLERPTDQCIKLSRLVRSGVAFHHAGLLNTQRGIIEEAFKANTIKVICSTTTLCLPKGEEIICNPEPRQIQTLTSNERVLTSTGKFREVIAPIKSYYNGPLVEIQPYFQLPMRMTPEHRVLVVRRKRHSSHYYDGTHKIWWVYSEPLWIKADELEKGHLVLFPRIKISKEPSALSVNLQGPLSNQTGIVGEHWSRLNKQTVKLDSKTLEIIGLFIAEGSTGKNGVIKFDINTNEQDLTVKIVGWCDSLGLRARINDNERHRRSVVACSKQVASKFRELFGNNAHNKHMPHDFLTLPKDKLIPLIRGMWEGDGSVSLKETYGMAEYVTVSKILAKQLFMALVKIGYMPSISCSKAKITKHKAKYNVIITNHSDSYRVRISGEQLTRFLKEIMQRRVVFKGNRTYNVGKIDKDYYYMPVRKITRKIYNGIVYNIEVKKDANYVGSFIVHNSMGINMPAHTVLVRDIHRYENLSSGMMGVNEVTQLFGRAGRPQYDTEGRALLIASSTERMHELYRNYITAKPEPVDSSLAVVPVLRSHILSLIATGFVNRTDSLEKFFSRSFYGMQYGSMQHLNRVISEVLQDLGRWEMITEEDEIFAATKLGSRVSELYIDPLSAKWMVDSLPNANDTIGMLFMISNTLEMRPYARVTKEAEEALAVYMHTHRKMMLKEFSPMDYGNYDPEGAFSTAMMLNDWMEEMKEPEVVKKYYSTPGALYMKINNADWLIYSAIELAKIIRISARKIVETRVRLRYGIKEELLDLVRLQQIGRARARMLYANGITGIESVRQNRARVASILGKEIAEKVFSQL